MNIIGVDDQWAIIVTLEKMLKKIDPDGQHRFYTDSTEALRELDQPVDVAFLDVEMPKMNGVTLAGHIIERYPECNIIFLTGYSEYMPSAFGLHASGYLLKPFSLGMLKEALEHLRYRRTEIREKPVRVRCFGSFEVFVDQKPVHFSRIKAKELFAFLIDQKGKMCDIETIISMTDPTSEINKSTKAQIRVYISDLIRTFEGLGIRGIVIKDSNAVGINVSLIDCDYYRLLENDPFVLSQYMGEYMIQYEFAETTSAILYNKYLK